MDWTNRKQRVTRETVERYVQHYGMRNCPHSRMAFTEHDGMKIANCWDCPFEVRFETAPPKVAFQKA